MIVVCASIEVYQYESLLNGIYESVNVKTLQDDNSRNLEVLLSVDLLRLSLHVERIQQLGRGCKEKFLEAPIRLWVKSPKTNALVNACQPSGVSGVNLGGIKEDDNLLSVAVNRYSEATITCPRR